MPRAHAPCSAVRDLRSWAGKLGALEGSLESHQIRGKQQPLNSGKASQLRNSSFPVLQLEAHLLTYPVSKTQISCKLSLLVVFPVANLALHSGHERGLDGKPCSRTSLTLPEGLGGNVVSK